MQRRSLAWLVAHIAERRRAIDRTDQSTDLGKQTVPKIEKANPMLDLASIPKEVFQADRQRWIDMLKKDHLKEIADELNAEKKPKKWHQIDGGPSNLCDLATALNRSSEYEILYRYWSRFSHAQTIEGAIDEDKAFVPLRLMNGSPEAIIEVVRFASSYGYRTTKRFVGFYRPGENMQSWYTEQILPRLEAFRPQLSTPPWKKE